MISFPKNKKRRIVVIFFALLLAAFFCFLKIDQNSLDVFAPARPEFGRQNLIEKLADKNEQLSANYGKLEISGGLGEDGAPNNATDKTNSENKTADANIAKELPRLLEIPKLGISAKVQHVGLNSDEEMDVPSNGGDVAWFNLGTKPGEIGSAVIAGHLDDRNGRPAVFWDVRKLEIGDAVFTVDGGGDKKRFRVVSLERYETGTAPVERIFGLSGGIYLNLITCGGVWDRAKNNYTERFVVFTEYWE